MKRIAQSLCVLLMLFTAGNLCAQVNGGDAQVFPTPSNFSSTRMGVYPIYTLNVAPVSGASLQITGAPGQAIYCYWAVANFQVGAVVSSLGCLNNGPNTLTSSNYLSITPFYYPPGTTGVDILQTTTGLQPSGTCTCAVTTGLTSGGVNQTSNTLSSYSVPNYNAQNYALTLTNEVNGSNQSQLVLRQGWPWPGTIICTFSSSGGCGGGGGSGCILTGTTTANFLVMFTGSGPGCTNSPLQYNSPELYDATNTDFFHMAASLIGSGNPTYSSGYGPFGVNIAEEVQQAFATSTCTAGARCGAFIAIAKNAQTSNLNFETVGGTFLANAGSNTASTSTGGFAAVDAFAEADSPSIIVSVNNVIGVNAYAGCETAVAVWSGPGSQCPPGAIPGGSNSQVITDQFGLSGISNATSISSINAGVYGQTQAISGTGNITDAAVTWDADFYADSPINSGSGGVITNHAGLYLANQSTNSFSAHNYGIYQAAADANELTGTTYFGGVGQTAGFQFAGTCTMSSGTTCSETVSRTYTSPACLVTVQGSTAIAGACNVSGTTVTVTAASSNSDTWAFWVFGNPN